tara:strand:- start:180 stop:509 length:330 start_codon:yes stop_codon:yes gene_type:complete
MKGIVVQFRRGRKTIHERHFLLDLDLKSREEAKKLAGKEVSWKSPGGKVIKGKISDAHGNSGLVRAIFEKGLPGQAITDEVEIVGGIEEEKGKKEGKDKGKREEKKEEK